MPRSTELTAIEQGILDDVALGLNNIQIGFKQHRSPETIRTHMKNIFAKLKARNRAQAVANAYRTGILQCPTPHVPLTQSVPTSSTPPPCGSVPAHRKRRDVPSPPRQITSAPSRRAVRPPRNPR
jgi:DNA-binding CsgD family transcriptional regulator